MDQPCLLRQKPEEEIVNKYFGFMVRINRYMYNDIYYEYDFHQ